MKIEMIYWLIIILGVILLSTSISNSFYKVIIGKYLQLNIYFEVLLRAFLFFLSIIVIFAGLYFESSL